MEDGINIFYDGLLEALSSYSNINDRIKELDKRFNDLSQVIFNGHFCVNGEYEIYPLDIEFYFHQEDEESDFVIKEPQMYHKGSSLPYFPKPYSICPNRSGVDITFENEENGIRASFLIRGYEYTDKDGRYINSEKEGCIRKGASGDILEEFKPQYLWEDMFGNASLVNDLHISWQPNKQYKVWTIKQSHRIRVAEPRLWRFTNIEYLSKL